MSAPRGQATLLPVAVLIAGLPTPLAWVVALSAVPSALWMERYFPDGTLF